MNSFLLLPIAATSYYFFKKKFSYKPKVKEPIEHIEFLGSGTCPNNTSVLLDDIVIIDLFYEMKPEYYQILVNSIRSKFSDLNITIGYWVDEEQLWSSGFSKNSTVSKISIAIQIATIDGAINLRVISDVRHHCLAFINSEIGNVFAKNIEEIEAKAQNLFNLLNQINMDLYINIVDCNEYVSLDDLSELLNKHGLISFGDSEVYINLERTQETFRFLKTENDSMCLVLNIASCVEPLSAFLSMTNFSKILADRFGARIVDLNYNTIDEHYIESVNSYIRNLCSTIESFGLKHGSELIRRLLS